MPPRAVATAGPRAPLTGGAGAHDIAWVGTAEVRPRDKEVAMPNTVARITEISSSSDVSFADAVSVGIERATKTLRGVTGAWVKDQKVEVKSGAITKYIVHLAVTFILDD